MPKLTKMSEEEYKARRKASCQKWQAKNRDILNAKARARYAENPQKEKDRHKEWASKRLDHLRKYEKQRYKDNSEKKRASATNWRRKNPEYNPMACKRYVANNREKIRAMFRRIGIMRRSAPGSFSVTDVDDIRRMQKGRCAYCKTRVSGKNEHLDHIIALANGGTHYRSNLQILCETCNKRKSRRDPVEFVRSEYGFLL